MEGPKPEVMPHCTCSEEHDGAEVTTTWMDCEVHGPDLPSNPEAVPVSVREALEFYADETKWTQETGYGSRIHDPDGVATLDGGRRARAALAATSEGEGPEAVAPADVLLSIEDAMALLPADERRAYEEALQSVVDARRSAERNEGQLWIQ